ncbi:hypothetical protein HDV06_004145 [Boothiomyces sp. JEL0866]|nr:hypothetical protein HDV06_004145 [Boothiomyces sp. JEL0866]
MPPEPQIFSAVQSRMLDYEVELETFTQEIELVFISTEESVSNNRWPVAGLHISSLASNITLSQMNLISKYFTLEDVIPVSIQLSPIGNMYYGFFPRATLEITAMNFIQQVQMNSNNLDMKFEILNDNDRSRLKISSAISTLRNHILNSKNKISLSGSGYHPKFNFEISDSSKIIVQFSRDYFIDPYEIARYSFDKVDVEIVGDIDLEVPSSSEFAHHHFLHMNVRGSDKIQIPFHLRYHDASFDYNTVNVDVIRPIIYSIVSGTFD